MNNVGVDLAHAEFALFVQVEFGLFVQVEFGLFVQVLGSGNLHGASWRSEVFGFALQHDFDIECYVVYLALGGIPNAGHAISPDYVVKIPDLVFARTTSIAADRIIGILAVSLDKSAGWLGTP